MRNWRRAFRRASFRGVRFWVDEDGPEKGRRIAVHDISGGESPVTEDMGRLSTEHLVTAYVASELADIEGLLLERACSSPGPSLLVLPMDAPLMAHCALVRRTRRKDRNGYIAYDLRFVPVGNGGASVASGLGDLRSVFAGGIGSAAIALGSAFL